MTGAEKLSLYVLGLVMGFGLGFSVCAVCVLHGWHP